jgi:hypothetical protein
MVRKLTIICVLLGVLTNLPGCIIHDPDYYNSGRVYYYDSYPYYYGPSFYAPFYFGGYYRGHVGHGHGYGHHR